MVTKYNIHINIEICNSILAVKYLYKYIYKDHDRVTVIFSQSNNISNIQLTEIELIDKIRTYLNTRYVSASESIWRIFYYKIHNCTSNV